MNKRRQLAHWTHIVEVVEDEIRRSTLIGIACGVVWILKFMIEWRFGEPQ